MMSIPINIKMHETSQNSIPQSMSYIFAIGVYSTQFVHLVYYNFFYGGTTFYVLCIIISVGSNGNCTPSCINGSCVSGNFCDCFEGWTGDICNQGNLYCFVVFSYNISLSYHT